MNSASDFFSNLRLLWLRVLMGLSIAYHGFGKVFGGRMEAFTHGVGEMGFPFPALFAWLAALSELVGGLLLVVGLATRPAALFIFVNMCVAAFIRHGADPFSRKELALAYGVIAGALILTGAGKLSLDALVFRGSRA